MPDLKLDIEINFTDKKFYDGKYGGTIKHKSFKLTPFTFKKTAKVEDETLKAAEVEKEFFKSAEGMMHSISYLIDSVIAENDKKGQRDLAVTSKQADEELAQWRRGLLKLLNATIDELGGNDTSEADNGKWQDKTQKFIGDLKHFKAVVEEYDSLIAELNATGGPRLTAEALAEERQKPGAPAQPDAAFTRKWDTNADAAETLFGKYEKGAADLQKLLKKKALVIDVPKAPQKESNQQKDKRLAMEELAKAVKKAIKQRDEFAAEMTEVTNFKTKVMTALRADAAKYRAKMWPEARNLKTVLKNLETAFDAAGKALKEAEKQSKT